MPFKVPEKFRKRCWAVLATVLLSVGGNAQACVTCNSATACQVRAGIFHHGFLHTLLLVAAPFPVLLGSVAAIAYSFAVPHMDRA